MWVHSTSPCIISWSSYDSKRYTERLPELQTRVKVTETQRRVCQRYVDELDLVDREAPLFCMKYGQDCRKTAPTCIFVHSAYDMTNADIANCLEAHNAMTGLATMVFDPCMLEVKESDHDAVISQLNVSWAVKKKFLWKKVIKFTFEGDCSWEYNHDYNTYIQKFKVMYIESNNGTRYFVTNERTWNGVRLIKYTRQCVIPMQPSTESFSLWYDTAGLVEFNYFILDDKFYYTGIRQSHNDKVLCLLLQYNPQQQHRHVLSLRSGFWENTHKYCIGRNDRRGYL